LTIDIDSGIAVFCEPQADNIGVGDEITYNGLADTVYISGRFSSTTYSVITAKGATPLDIFGSGVDSINRAFTSLNAANTGSSNATHLDTTDLAGQNFQLHWPCYNDNPMDDRLST
jgi:hypothetical protein